MAGYETRLAELRESIAAADLSSQAAIEEEKERFAAQRVAAALEQASGEVTALRAEMSRQHTAALLRAEADYTERIAGLAMEHHQIEANMKKAFVEQQAETTSLMQEKHEVNSALIQIIEQK